MKGWRNLITSMHYFEVIIISKLAQVLVWWQALAVASYRQKTHQDGC